MEDTTKKFELEEEIVEVVEEGVLSVDEPSFCGRFCNPIVKA